MTRPLALIFDVNETMLDLTVMRPVFADHLGSEKLVPAWFSLLLRYSLESNVVGHYISFEELGRSALRVVVDQAGLSPSNEIIATVVRSMEHLPAHPDVIPALARLKDVGFLLATLSNSSSPTVEAQLRNAGIREFFDHVISIDAVGSYKPSRLPYRWAVTQLGTALEDTMLIAAHDWDVNGAHLAGLQAAFVERPSSTTAPHNVLPALRGPTLTEIAGALVEMNS